MAKTTIHGDRFSFNRVLSHAFEMVRSNKWRVFFWAALLIGVPCFILEFADAQFLNTADNVYINVETLAVSEMSWVKYMYASLGTMFLFLLSYALVSWISFACYMALFAQKFSRGTKDDRIQSLDASQTLWELLIPLAILSVLLSLGIMTGLVALVLPGLFLAVIWCVSIPVMALEGMSIRGAFVRSRQLVRGHKWNVLVVVVLLFFAEIGIAIFGDVVANVIGIIDEMGDVSVAGSYLYSVSYSFIGAFFYALTCMFSASMTVATYWELRFLEDGIGANSISDIFD